MVIHRPPATEGPSKNGPPKLKGRKDQRASGLEAERKKTKEAKYSFQLLDAIKIPEMFPLNLDTHGGEASSLMQAHGSVKAEPLEKERLSQIKLRFRDGPEGTLVLASITDRGVELDPDDPSQEGLRQSIMSLLASYAARRLLRPFPAQTSRARVSSSKPRKAADYEIGAERSSGEVSHEFRETTARLEKAEGFDYAKKSPLAELKEEGAVNALEKILEERKIPRKLWPKAAVAVERALEKVAAQVTDRPLWDDQSEYPEFAGYSAPRFLRAVWGDKISKRGVVNSKEIIDQDLLNAVGHYMSTRRRRGLDMGDAKGLLFIKKKLGRPRNTSKRKQIDIAPK